MKKFFPLVFCALFLLVSCKKNKEAITPEAPEPEKPVIVEDFIFQGISYSLNPDYKEILVSEEKRLSTLINRTSVTQSIEANTSGVYEYSLFKNNGDQIFNIKDPQKLEIKVPQYVADGRIYLGEAKWKYSTTGETLPTTLTVKQSIPVQPNTQTTATALLTYRENTIPYVATFVGEKTGKKLEINGTWTGRSLLGVDFREKSEPVK